MFQRIAARLTINAVIVALIVGALAWQTIRIEGFKIWPISHKGLKAELADVKAELKRISTAKNEQKQTTGRTIAETRIIYRDAESRAQRVEKAPTVERCKTPQEVLSADL